MAGFDIGSVYAKVDADISGFKNKMNEVKDVTDDAGKKFTHLGESLKKFANQATIFSAVAGAGLTVFLKSSSQEAINLERSLTTLDIIAGRFGVSAEDAKNATMELSKELRIGVSSTAESLQNLLKSGLGLDEAKDLLKRFTNEAITGKSPTISLSQAVQNLSFAYATNNSMLGNLSGISENFNDIVERGKKNLLAQGKSLEEITPEMAKYAGMIELTNLTMGSSERFQGTLIDNQAILSQAIVDTQVAFGQGLNPVLNEFIILFLNSGIIEKIQAFAQEFGPKLIDAVNKTAEWISENQGLVISFLNGLGVALTALLIVGTINGLLMALLNPLTIVVIAITVLYTAWDQNWMGIKDITQWVYNFLVDLWVNQLKPMMDTVALWWQQNGDLIIAIISNVWNIIKAIFSQAFNVIAGTVKIYMAIINGDWNKAWETIKNTTSIGISNIKTILTNAVDIIKNIGGLIYNAIKEPFENAWNTVKEKMDQIKDAVDFTKRHSPSVVDIINRGVDQANKALGGLSGGLGLNANVAGASVANSSMVSNVNVRIDLAGAIIGDEFGASSIAEKVGDSIIRKLQANIRI